MGQSGNPEISRSRKWHSFPWDRRTIAEGDLKAQELSHPTGARTMGGRGYLARDKGDGAAEKKELLPGANTTDHREGKKCLVFFLLWPSSLRPLPSTGWTSLKARERGSLGNVIPYDAEQSRKTERNAFENKQAIYQKTGGRGVWKRGVKDKFKFLYTKILIYLMVTIYTKRYIYPINI